MGWDFPAWDLSLASNEMHLFHGTDSKSAETICVEGFDWRLCGKNRTAFGKGCYFAASAGYSHGYTSADRDGIYHMLLARVLVGEYTLGDPEMVLPPPKHPSRPFELYDSTVDNEKSPTIFVIYDFGQSYPEYLIEYRVCKPPKA